MVIIYEIATYMSTPALTFYVFAISNIYDAICNFLK